MADVRLVRHLADLPHTELAGGSVVTIGSYDGLHPGHRQLLERLLIAAREQSVPSVVNRTSNASAPRCPMS